MAIRRLNEREGLYGDCSKRGICIIYLHGSGLMCIRDKAYRGKLFEEIDEG